MCANVSVRVCTYVARLCRRCGAMQSACVLCALLIGPLQCPLALIGRSTQSTTFPAPPPAVIDLFGLSYTRVKLTINGVKLISHCLPKPSPSSLHLSELFAAVEAALFLAFSCKFVRLNVAQSASVACLTVSLTVCLCLCALFINK